MKLCLFLTLLAVCTHGAPSDGISAKDAATAFARNARQAERVVFTTLSAQKEARTVTVKDRVWIFDLARVLAGAAFEPQEHVFATSGPISFLDQEGKKILEIQVLPGGVLRVEGIDYQVGRKTNDAIVELLKEKEANQALQPTAPSGRG